MGRGTHSDNQGERRLWDHLTLGAEGREKVLHGFPLLWQGTVGGVWVVSWRVNWERVGAEVLGNS